MLIWLPEGEVIDEFLAGIHTANLMTISQGNSPWVSEPGEDGTADTGGHRKGPARPKQATGGEVVRLNGPNTGCAVH